MYGQERFLGLFSWNGKAWGAREGGGPEQPLVAFPTTRPGLTAFYVLTAPYQSSVWQGANRGVSSKVSQLGSH